MNKKLLRFISVTSYAANSFLATSLAAGDRVVAFMTGAPEIRLIRFQLKKVLTPSVLNSFSAEEFAEPVIVTVKVEL